MPIPYLTGAHIIKKANRSREKTQQQKNKDFDRYIETFGPAIVEDVLDVFVELTERDLFKKNRQWPHAHARQILIAAYYHLTLNGRSKRAVARAMGLKETAIGKALRTINRTIRSDMSSKLKKGIELACLRFEVEPDRLMLPKKRSRR